jgi:hypothetical protein
MRTTDPRILILREPLMEELFPINISLSALANATRVGRFRELRHRWHATPLELLYEDLLAYFSGIEEIELNPQRIRCEVVSLGTFQENMVHQILDYGYSCRYQVQGTVVDMGHLVLDSTPFCATLATIQDFKGRSIVLSTVRVLWEHHEVFELFEIREHGLWPHQETMQRFGEIGRISMHPLLDLLSNSSSPDLSECGKAYKAALFKKAMELAAVLLKEKEIVSFYYIAAPKVQRFFERVGLPSTRIERATLCMSPTAQTYHELLPLYFRLSEPPENQPSAYYSQVVSPSDWLRN